MTHPPTTPQGPAFRHGFTRDWPEYFAVMEGKGPRETTVLALDRFAAEGVPDADGDSPLAVDLGCGEGRDSAALLARSRRPIKSALLDQTMIAGLGNIYADEALFASGIHPLTPCHAIPRPAATRLSRAIKRTLTVAIAAGGSTLRDYVNADGTAGGFQLRHRVYARTSQPCRRCRTSVERLVLSGRSTHFCPTCQPALAA